MVVTTLLGRYAYIADSANLDKMATSSCSVFLKRPHETGRTELCIEDVRELTVQELMDKVAEKMNVPTKEFRESDRHLK